MPSQKKIQIYIIVIIHTKKLVGTTNIIVKIFQFPYKYNCYPIDNVL